MRREPIKHHMDGLLSLLVFGVFAVCILLVLLTGAEAYRRLTERDGAAFDLRTAAQYVATKVRQNDRAGGVYLADFHGGDGSDGWADTLYLAEDIDGEIYVTRIYWYDGYLRELFSAQGEELAPADGEPVLSAGGLRFTTDGGRILAEVTDPAGDCVRLYLTTRSGEEAAA